MEHTKTFRLSQETAAAIKKAAQAEGLTQSEFVRRAVEGRLCKSSSGAVDPYELIVHAAKGGLQAQRELVRQCIGWAIQEANEGHDPVRFLIEALVFARMAAAHGTPGDQGVVLSTIAIFEKLTGDIDDSDAADMIGRLAFMADAGVPYADDALPDLAEGVTAEIMAAAQSVRARLRDEMTGVEQ